jgi:hypothetical protein
MMQEADSMRHAIRTWSTLTSACADCIVNRMTYRYDPAFIRAIPKTDLHVHLDGSLRIPTLIELARERKIQLPSFTEEGLNEKVFKSSYANLVEYLSGFSWTLRDRKSVV